MNITQEGDDQSKKRSVPFDLSNIPKGMTIEDFLNLMKGKTKDEQRDIIKGWLDEK